MVEEWVWLISIQSTDIWLILHDAFRIVWFQLSDSCTWAVLSSYHVLEKTLPPIVIVEFALQLASKIELEKIYVLVSLDWDSEVQGISHA